MAQGIVGLVAGNRVQYSYDHGNTHIEGIVTRCNAPSTPWDKKPFANIATRNGLTVGQEISDHDTTTVYVRELARNTYTYWVDMDKITSVVDRRPMTAATVTFYINSKLIDTVYLDHEEAMRDLDHMIEDARKATFERDDYGNLTSAQAKVYICWHEHDVCEDPASCTELEIPNFPDYEFMQGREITGAENVSSLVAAHKSQLLNVQQWKIDQDFAREEIDLANETRQAAIRAAKFFKKNIAQRAWGRKLKKAEEA